MEIKSYFLKSKIFSYPRLNVMQHTWKKKIKQLSQKIKFYEKANFS